MMAPGEDLPQAPGGGMGRPPLGAGEGGTGPGAAHTHATQDTLSRLSRLRDNRYTGSLPLCADPSPHPAAHKALAAPPLQV